MKRRTVDLHGQHDGGWFEDADLPADPLETHELDDEDVIRRVRGTAAERGGRMIPGPHEDRHTVFKVEQNGVTQKRNADLATCGHEAEFAITPKGGGRMVTACVVCDSADRWPRFVVA